MRRVRLLGVSSGSAMRRVTGLRSTIWDSVVVGVAPCRRSVTEVMDDRVLQESPFVSVGAEVASFVSGRHRLIKFFSKTSGMKVSWAVC